MSYAKKYSFQGVGELDIDIKHREAAAEVENLPIGIKTPMELGSDQSFLKMHKTFPDAIADNFRNMVMTNHGERLGHYDFGGNLLELAFEIGSDKGDTEAIRRIARTTKKYMPFVTLDSFEPFIQRDGDKIAQIGVRVTYSVPQVEKKLRAIEVLIYAAG